MKKNICLVIIVLLSVAVSSCGFKKINDQEVNLIYISKFKLDGEKRVGYIIKNQILLISDKLGKNNIEITLKAQKSKNTKEKDKTGKMSKETVTITAIIDIKTDERIITRSFSKSGDYDIANSHSDTITREKKITSNITEQVAENVVKFLKLTFRN